MGGIGYSQSKISDMMFIVNELVTNAFKFGINESNDEVSINIGVGLGAIRIEVRQRRSFSESKFDLVKKVEKMAEQIKKNPTRKDGRGLFLVAKKCNGELFSEKNNTVTCNLLKTEDGLNDSTLIDVPGVVGVEIRGALKGSRSESLYAEVAQKIAKASEVKVLVLHFIDSEFIDSRALGALGKLHALSKSKKFRIFLMSASQNLLDLLENSSMLGFFSLVFSREELIAEM